MTKITVAAMLASCALVGACHKASEGGAHLKDVERAFADEGWKLAEFQPTDAQRYSAQKCVTGAIEGLDVIVCEFGSQEAVQRGKHAAEAWVAQAVTGVSLENGRTVLGIADRAHADPNGKLIHRVTQRYRGIK